MSKIHIIMAFESLTCLTFTVLSVEALLYALLIASRLHLGWSMALWLSENFLLCSSTSTWVRLIQCNVLSYRHCEQFQVKPFRLELIPWNHLAGKSNLSKGPFLQDEDSVSRISGMQCILVLIYIIYVSNLTFTKKHQLTWNRLSACEAYQNDKFEILGLEVR